MHCQQVLSPVVPVLSLNDNPDKALQLMDEYNLTQLPIVENGTFMGIVKEDGLLDLSDTETSFSKINNEFFKPAILSTSHVYEAVKIFIKHQLQILPVIGADAKYLGCITTDSLSKYLVMGLQAHEQGGIVQIGVTEKNYSLGQIARIAESENITILSTLLHSDKKSGHMELTIKTNKTDLRSFVSTLERMNYNIIEVYAEMGDGDDLKSNYEGLLKYLQM
jgi:acetoin utilization protein AcuB